MLRDARTVNAKVQLLARIGTALIEARESDGDVESSVGWDRIAASIAWTTKVAADILAASWPSRTPR